MLILNGVRKRTTKSTSTGMVLERGCIMSTMTSTIQGIRQQWSWSFSLNQYGYKSYCEAYDNSYDTREGEDLPV